MRAPRAAGSCYRSQVRRADKRTMTTLPPGCVRTLTPALPLPRPPKTEICQWLAEIVGIPGIPPDPKQPTTRQEGERRPASGRRGVFCQRYPLWNERRCNISQDKGPLCLGKHAGCAAAVHGEYLEAAVGHAKRLFALRWMSRRELRGEALSQPLRDDLSILLFPGFY